MSQRRVLNAVWKSKLRMTSEVGESTDWVEPRTSCRQGLARRGPDDARGAILQLEPVWVGGSCSDHDRSGTRIPSPYPARKPTLDLSLCKAVGRTVLAPPSLLKPGLPVRKAFVRSRPGSV